MTPEQAAQLAELDVVRSVGAILRLWLLTQPSPASAMSMGAYLRASALTLDQTAERVIRERSRST